MTKYKFTPKDIFEQHFDRKMRGYDPDQVDLMLDDVIRDYESFQDEILALREENEFLRSKLANAEKQASPNPADFGDTKRIEPVEVVKATQEVKAAPKAEKYQEGSNFDVLKRLSRLELAVFGPKTEEN
ncbi:DivIVA domain-containing protein [Streptococcaceae bacterium ESL0729]|nr:DivIVA domain-containing protein [Streptococcaceae bacterium ESL0729]